MTAPPEDDPAEKVTTTLSRHTNDIAALYELQTKTHTEVTKIAGVQRKHGRQLDTIESRLGNMHGWLGNVAGRLGNVDGRLDTMNGRLDSHSQKLDEILGILRPAE